jgi:hypothetical protein
MLEVVFLLMDGGLRTKTLYVKDQRLGEENE